MADVPLSIDHQDFETLAPIAGSILKAGGGWPRFSVEAPALLRRAIDEVIDAPRTNRFTIREIEKTEKTYLGTKVEILIRNYLKLPRGSILDLSIDGIEVDIKNTMSSNWTIPREAIGHTCLIIRENEVKSICDVGLIVARAEYLNAGQNRDQKRTFRSAAISENTWWLLKHCPYPRNFFETMPKKDRERIMRAGAARQRLAELFDVVQEVPISGQIVEAISQQADYMKRLRRNGGARDILAPKGIAVLWGQADASLIAQLGLPITNKDEFISFRAKTEEQLHILRTKGHID
jgi:hypothetical protein